MILNEFVAKKSWAFFAISSLFLASLLAIVLIAMRVPYSPLSTIDLNVFYSILVLHVIFSFLIWLTSAICHIAILQLNMLPSSKFMLYLAAIGILCLLISIFLPDFNPLPIDYFPISTSSLFMLGMFLYLTAVCSVAFRAVRAKVLNIADHMLKGAMLCLILAIFSPFLLSGTLQTHLEGMAKYEQLFWASGHIYVCALGTFISSLWIKNCLHNLNNKSLRILTLISYVPFLASSVALIYTLSMNLTSKPLDYHDLFKNLMIYISCLPVASVFILDFNRLKTSKLSILIIGILSLGVLQGFFMTLGTLTVPAHYHAMLGLTNLILFIAFSQSETTQATQPKMLHAIYGSSVLMVSLSLWFLGSFGAVRKVTYTYMWIYDSLQYLFLLFLVIGGTLMLISTTAICFKIFNSIKEPPMHFEARLLQMGVKG